MSFCVAWCVAGEPEFLSSVLEAEAEAGAEVRGRPSRRLVPGEIVLSRQLEVRGQDVGWNSPFVLARPSTARTEGQEQEATEHPLVATLSLKTYIPSTTPSSLTSTITEASTLRTTLYTTKEATTTTRATTTTTTTTKTTTKTTIPEYHLDLKMELKDLRRKCENGL